MRDIITLDLQKSNTKFITEIYLKGRRGDSRSLSRTFQILDGGEPINLTDCTVTFMAENAGGHKIVEEVTDKDQAGQITYTFPAAVVAVRGSVTIAYFKVSGTNADGEDFIASTNSLHIEVLDNVDLTNDITGDYVPMLDKLIEQSEEMAANADELVKKTTAALNDLNVVASQATAEAEAARVEAETGRVNAENARVEAEAARVSAETAREAAFDEAIEEANTATEGAEKVNATLSGTNLTVTNRNGVSTTIDTKGEKGDKGDKGDKGEKGEQGEAGSSGSSEDTAYNHLASIGAYTGRSIKDILGCSTWDETYTALHTKIAAGDFSDLRIADYLDVTFTDTTVTQDQTIRFLIAQFNPYTKGNVTTSDSTNKSCSIAFLAKELVKVQSGVTGATSEGCITWRDTANNNGTSSQAAPYLLSNLYAFEQALSEKLPSTLKANVLSSPSITFEKRYKASATLTDSNSYETSINSRFFSLSEVEVFGRCLHGTKLYSEYLDYQFDLFRTMYFHTPLEEWWLRTVASGSSSEIICANNGGHSTNSPLYTYCYPRPCFILA